MIDEYGPIACPECGGGHCLWVPRDHVVRHPRVSAKRLRRAERRYRVGRYWWCHECDNAGAEMLV